MTQQTPCAPSIATTPSCPPPCLSLFLPSLPFPYPPLPSPPRPSPQQAAAARTEHGAARRLFASLGSFQKTSLSSKGGVASAAAVTSDSNYIRQLNVSTAAAAADVAATSGSAEAL